MWAKIQNIFETNKYLEQKIRIFKQNWLRKGTPYELNLLKITVQMIQVWRKCLTFATIIH